MLASLAVAAGLVVGPGSNEEANAASVPPGSATVTIRTDKPTTNALRTTSQGISLETRALTSPVFTNATSSTFPQYLRSIGTGILRVGANDADISFWTSTGERAPAWAKVTLTPKTIDDLARVARDTNRQVIVTVNLKQYVLSNRNPDHLRRAVELAAYAKRVLGTSLYGIEIGNEPEFYYAETDAGAAAFIADFNTFVNAIRSAAGSDTPFVGAGAQKGGKLSNAFLADQKAQRDIVALTRHFYPADTCGTKTITIPNLLSAATYKFERDSASLYASQARELGVPMLINETNSVACEGEKGVSDTFASALWALDYGLLAAQQGVASVDFHASVSQCSSTPPDFKYYTPFCSPSSRSFNAGQLRAKPEYYGLLALNRVSEGSFLQLDNTASDRLRTYAITNGSRTTVVVVNVDDPNNFSARPATINLGKRYTSARAVDLRTSSSAGLASTSSITLGGATVSSSGEISDVSQRWVPLSNNGNRLNLNVPAGSATIVTLR